MEVALSPKKKEEVEQMHDSTHDGRVFSSRVTLISAIKEFPGVTWPEVAGSLASRVTDNFQLLKPASSSCTCI
ncbi:hypothetical protein NX722_07285 [Endozoicomonas gorgoniicola]|uniref:Uncharacterized protein n=1 Tax=Endozoicomonas gorgoniicola TaxID=1234144 RepID=A0ABT3MTY6_9GAMM|nr:hypothetical protein [Endozoicomonas gorgoniicola]MCW7552449.1 hypothetical protein [Endozoicomonas gorgoniicola]